MSIETSGELIERVKSSMGSSSSLLEPEQFDFVATQALNELGFKYPITDSKKELWAVERGRRHALDILRVQSAHRFRYKQLSLNHRFDHYDALIKEMDKRFEQALESDTDLLGIDFSGVMGVYVENGFVYDDFGNDITKIVYEMNYGE